MNVPYVFSTPDGVTPADAQAGSSKPSNTESANPLLTYLTGDRGRRSLLVGGEGTFEASYPPEAARPGAAMAGAPDVAGWILYALRENLVAVAGNNQNNKRIPEAVAFVDRSVASTAVTDCVSKAVLPDHATVRTTVAAVRSGYASCLPTAITALGGTYAQHNGGNAERIAQTLTRGVNTAKGQDRRADTSFQRRLLMSVSEESALSDPVRSTIPVSRFMTKEEVFALPAQTPRGTWDASRCPPPPAEDQPRPVGLGPEAQCFYLFEADLDGNGARDRVLTWTRGRPAGRGVEGAGSGNSQGASAYLDSGKIAVLSSSEARANWMSDFEATRTAYLGNDRREQVMVEYEDGGASTLWFAVLGLGPDGNLPLARQPSGGALGLAVGGAASTSSGYGCYSRDGRGRLAHWSWTRTSPITAAGRQSSGDLTVTPLELNDLVATRVGDDLKYVTLTSPNAVDHPVGGACDTADPGQRGTYGVHLPGAQTQAEREAAIRAAAQRALQAVVSGDQAAIRSSFAPEAVPQAVAVAQMVAGSSGLRSGLECTNGESTAAAGLSSDVSCNATFNQEVGWLDVALGRDAQGRYRAVGIEVIGD